MKKYKMPLLKREREGVKREGKKKEERGRDGVVRNRTLGRQRERERRREEWSG